MKKYRLKEDTVLLPEGAIAVPTEAGGDEYEIILSYGRPYYMRIPKIELNSLWEEITEDQREEEIKLPIGGESFFTIDIYGNIERKFWNADDSLNTQFRKIFKAGNAFKTRKEAEEELEQRMGLRHRLYYCELPTSNSQTLREESLKELGYTYVTYNTGRADLKINMPTKYLDAWRDLLDKKEG